MIIFNRHKIKRHNKSRFTPVILSALILALCTVFAACGAADYGGEETAAGSSSVPPQADDVTGALYSLTSKNTG